MTWVALLLVTLLLYIAVGLRSFDRHREWAIIFTLGRTDRHGIRWHEAPVLYYPIGFQLAIGGRVYIWTALGLQRVQRVSGELQGAWQALRAELPWGVKVRRPTRDGSGRWSVRAWGWDEDSVAPYPLQVEGHGVTEAAAILDLEARLWEAMRDD